jgi:hypothetical protein
VPWIKAHAVLIDACVASFSQTTEAKRLLRAAEGQFDAVDMALHAAICAYRHAQLEQSDHLALAAAEARVRALGVAKPAGFARMLAPGAFGDELG